MKCLEDDQGFLGRVRSPSQKSVISSSLFIWHAAMKRIVLDMKKGKVKKVYLVGVPDGGAAMAPFNRKVSPEIARRVRAVEKDIKNGKIKVPYLGKKMIK